MRRILLFLGLLFFFLSAGAAVCIFLFADQIILNQVRKQAANFPPSKIEIGSLTSHWLGKFALELGEIQIAQTGTSVKLKEVKVRSSLSAFALFQAYTAKKEIPLSIELIEPRISQSASPASSAKSSPGSWPKMIPVPAMSPQPVQLELKVVNGEIRGLIEARDIQASTTLRANPNGMEASATIKALAGAAGGEALVPLSLDAKLAGNPRVFKLQSMTFKAAGIEGSGSGELNLQPVRGNLKLNMEAPDLAHLSLRPEDRAALGLTAQPTGAFSLKTELTAQEDGALTTVGVLRLQNASFPVKVPERTLWSGIAKGHRIEGTISLATLLPFRADFRWPMGSTPPKITVEQAAVAADFTQAKIDSKSLMQKPIGVPLKISGSISAKENGVKLDSVALTFHTLQLSASAALPPPLGESVDANFKAQVASLSGFPKLLPMLSGAAEGAGASLDDAQGSINVEGRLHGIAAAPAKSMVELKQLSIRGLRMPIAFASSTMEAKGKVEGSATIQGKYDNGDLNVAQSSGSFNLTDLDLALKDKLEKKRGRKLIFAFDAKGSPSRLQVSKISLIADGLTATLAGSAAFAKNRSALLALNTTVKAQLGPLREYLPKNLPAKISDGSIDAQMKITGTWLPEGGIEKSPLEVTGKMAARLGTVTMPEPPKTETSAKPLPPPGALLPPWPIARNARLDGRIDIAQFSRGSLRADAIAIVGNLNHGSFTASAGVGKVFGGKAALRNLTGSLLDPKLALKGQASAENLDISQAAGFVDPSYGKIVKGNLKADAAFALPSLWAQSILETATCQGKANINNGYLSTASFDGLVNEKLKGIPGVGDKAKVNTGGLTADIHTQFNYAGSVAALQNFVATTPKKDEMRLQGTFGLNFDCDLSGEAHLATAPVTGAVREANSDPEGRLVVPVRFHGNLKSPQVDVATNAIQLMLQKTAAHEGEKLKAKAIEGAKAKAQSTLEDAAGGLLDQFKKKLK